MLVMPQDKQAPKGRLILPQVQTLRALLDKGCNAICTTPEELPGALSSMASVPDLVITDSQVFSLVHSTIPEGCRLTSFSVLMAAVQGGYRLFHRERIHYRISIPRRQRAYSRGMYPRTSIRGYWPGKDPGTAFQASRGPAQYNDSLGKDFPDDLSPYKLIIHCGGCMFNRRLILNRISAPKRQNVPMTNYGIAIAYLTGILDKIVY